MGWENMPQRRAYDMTRHISADLEKGQEDGYVVAGNAASTRIGCGEVWKHPFGHCHSAALMEDTRKLCWQEGMRAAQEVLKLTRRRAADCTVGETLEDVGYHWNPGLGNQSPCKLHDRKRRWSWSNRLHYSRMCARRCRCSNFCKKKRCSEDFMSGNIRKEKATFPRT